MYFLYYIVFMVCLAILHTALEELSVRMKNNNLSYCFEKLVNPFLKYPLPTAKLINLTKKFWNKKMPTSRSKDGYAMTILVLENGHFVTKEIRILVL